MKHRTTRELFAYWDRRRNGRALPDRMDIEPGDIRRLLGDTFILACDSASGHPFRLAGTRLCALTGHELKGESFLGLWESRADIEALMATLVEDGVGAVASVGGQTERGDTVQLELLLLPLRHGGRQAARMIGSLVPMTKPYWIGTNPVIELMLGAYRHVGSALDRVPWPLFQVPPHKAHGFVVHQGGRRD